MSLKDEDRANARTIIEREEPHKAQSATRSIIYYLFTDLASIAPEIRLNSIQYLNNKVHELLSINLI